jgi:hypothetical protein
VGILKTQLSKNVYVKNFPVKIEMDKPWENLYHYRDLGM